MRHRSRAEIYEADESVPKKPFYKDERFAKLVSAAWIARVGLVAAIGFVALGTWAVLYVLGLSANLKHTQVVNHNNNVINQEQTKTQIRNLACFAINGGTDQRAIDIGKQYNCPPSQPFIPEALPTSLPKPTPTVTVTKSAQSLAGPTVTKTASATVTAMRTPVVPKPTTVTAHSTQTIIVPSTETVVRRATVTATVTRTPILCVPGLLC